MPVEHARYCSTVRMHFIYHISDNMQVILQFEGRGGKKFSHRMMQIE